MRRILSIVLAAAGVGFSSYNLNAATLNGDSVVVEMLSNGSSFGAQNILVGTGEDGNYFNNQFFDLDFGIVGDIFTITSRGSYSSIDGPGGIIDWYLTDLNFGVPLIAFDIIQSFSNVAVDSIAPTSVKFSYEDIAIPNGTYFSARFVTSEVPIPAALPLLGSALIIFGAIARAKRRPSMEDSLTKL